MKKIIWLLLGLIALITLIWLMPGSKSEKGWNGYRSTSQTGHSIPS